MKVPLIVASGQALIPYLLIGFPSILIGIVCLSVRNSTGTAEDKDRRSRRRLAILGGAFFALALLSPTLNPLLRPLLMKLLGPNSPY